MILGSLFFGGDIMQIDTDAVDVSQTTVMRLQHMLKKIDRVCLPPASRRDLESILVRQVAHEMIG